MPKQTTGSVVVILFFITLAVSLFFHLSGIGGDFLSDDFSHAYLIGQKYNENGLLHWVIERFYTPLDSGNYAYRPVVFASYALDFFTYGVNAAGWHLTNLITHVVNGFRVMVLVGRLAANAGVTEARFAAFTSASLFLAIPFAGETTFWPVGRFDLMACTFSLIFLMLLLWTRAPPGIKRTLALLTCMLLALLSKESAMPMIAVGFMLVFVHVVADQHFAGVGYRSKLIAATRESFARYWPVIVLALVYFAWRYYLFGSPWKVYPDSHLPQSIAELSTRVTVLKHVLEYPYAAQAGFWGSLLTLTVVTWLIGLTGAVKRASFMTTALTIVLFFCFVGYLLAPATSFPIATTNGEGMRNLYFPWAMFSLFAGFAIVHHRIRIGLLCVGLIIAFWGQWRLLSLWQMTADQMLRVTTAIPALANSIDDSQYALLLLPDHVKAVPFVRNAQGGVVMPPRQPISYQSKMAAMTTQAFEEWEHHMSSNTIGKLKGGTVVFDRADFSGVYCWIPSHGEFRRLNTMPYVDNARKWKIETLIEAKSISCLL